MTTRAIEDYLKTIYELQRIHDSVPTTVLADRLSVAPASATGMIKKMAGLGLLIYEPYQGAALSSEGLVKALKVLRAHRLAELYLVEMLGVPWEHAHEEAEKWEHVLSDDLEFRIDALLGHPTVCPHGSPIPKKDGTVTQTPNTPLSDMKTGQQAIIARIYDHDPELLRYFAELRLYPGVVIELLSIAPMNSLFRIRADDSELSLGREAASRIFVTITNKTGSE